MQMSDDGDDIGEKCITYTHWKLASLTALDKRPSLCHCYQIGQERRVPGYLDIATMGELETMCFLYRQVWPSVDTVEEHVSAKGLKTDGRD